MTTYSQVIKIKFIEPKVKKKVINTDKILDDQKLLNLVELKSLKPRGAMPADPITQIVTYFNPTDPGDVTMPPPRIKQPIAVVRY